MSSKLSLPKKLVLIVFGIFLSIALLEISFRIGSSAFYFFQKRGNALPGGSSHVYRIMCLGESTTGFGGRYSYPNQLEEILNQGLSPARFKVINKGVPGAHSSLILSNLEQNINEYKPDMVTVMMGVNDVRGFVSAAGIPRNIRKNQLKSLKVYTFLRLIVSHLKEKTKHTADDTEEPSILYIIDGLNKKNEESAQELIKQINERAQEYGLYREYAIYCFEKGKIEEAKEFIRKYLDTNQAGVKELLDIGRIYRLFNQKNEARSFFLKAFSLAPEKFSPYKELALFYKAEREFRIAEDIINNYLADNPYEAEACRELALLYLEQMKLAKAEDILQNTISSGNKDLATLCLLAKIYVLGESPGKALEVYRSALNDSQGHYSINIAFANVFLSSGYIEEAEKLFRKPVSQKEKEDERLYFGLARVYTRKKQYRKAEEFFEKALQINSDKSVIWEDLANCYSEQKLYSKAEIMFKKAINLEPDNPSIYESLGHMYNQQNKFREAEAVFKRSMAMAPYSASSLDGLTFAYYNSGKVELAEQIAKRRIDDYPRDPYSYIVLAKYYFYSALNDRAISVLRKAIDLEPYNYKPYKVMGDCLINKEYFAEARDCLEKASALCHDVSEKQQVNVQLARCYNALGNLSKSEAILKEIVSKNPYNYLAFIELGYCYWTQEKYKEAEEWAHKAISLNPFECRGYLLLESCYKREGKEQEEDILYNNLVYNYRKIAEAVQQNGIVLVCIQYPVCDVGQLRNILTGFEGIIFVDNEEVFKEALESGDYSDYFADDFGGEFGHCTPKGNRLLAESIADTLIREYFGKFR